ncbi:Patatin phospholipase domain-containing protein 2 [Fasciola hepatica]|uniref:Patatin phospholipase domain-containing protein 2 n=1 Tax=Fasciola hepatica TaxID=6192 RepID=A0A4E0R1F7_FASHE|nr:Patatin phospholipase domain-containing protein 2 [Fasciola hepatica]
MHESQEQIKFHEDRYYQDRSNLRHNLSFAGCGFLGLYHVGVCCCIKKLAPHLYQNKLVSGTSAGAIAAVCLVCDVSIAECVQYMCELISNARRYLFGPFDPRFRITEHLREGLNRILPSDAHIICSGRLSISLTSYATHKNVVVNQFRDKDELVNAVLCSAYIPIFSGFVPPTFRGQSVLDGGLSDNLLCIDKMTIRVSPFAGDADICPLDAPWDSGYLAPAPQHFEDVIGSISFLNNNIRVNRTNIRRLICVVWPMKSDELASLACQGYEDARRFLIARGFIACRLHRHSRFSLSTYNVRGDFGLTTANSVRRFRRNTSLQNLGTNHTEFLSKRRLSGIESSHSNRPPPSPSLRCQAAHSSINLVHLNSAHGLGWNVFECAACQEELRKANNSTLPAFLLSIIRGDGKLKRGPSVPFLTSSLQIIEQGWTLVQDAIQSGTSSLYWLGRHLFCLPLLVQLDVLIGIVTRLNNACDERTRISEVWLFIKEKNALIVLNRSCATQLSGQVTWYSKEDSLQCYIQSNSC